MSLKRFDFCFLLSIAIIGCVLSLSGPKPHVRTIHRHPTPATMITTQQRESHILIFVDKSDEPIGSCSARAIGPHAVITATHCLSGRDVFGIKIDMSEETHDIVSVATDGRDHMLLLIDGTAFKNYEKIKVGKVQINDVVTYYGSGGDEYPPVPKFGKVTDCQDPSDMDEAAEIVCFDTSSIFGDSGSTVYNDKGEVVALVTYLIDQGTGKPTTTVGFGLNFTQAQYDRAFEFIPKA